LFSSIHSCFWRLIPFPLKGRLSPVSQFVRMVQISDQLKKAREMYIKNFNEPIFHVKFINKHMQQHLKANIK
ncbi:MAG: hypothetical protein QXK31_06505, partial [Fervidicoccaceae archaeon]